MGGITELSGDAYYFSISDDCLIRGGPASQSFQVMPVTLVLLSVMTAAVRWYLESCTNGCGCYWW